MAVVETGNPIQDVPYNVRAVLRANTALTAIVAAADIECRVRTDYVQAKLPRIDIRPGSLEEARDEATTYQVVTLSLEVSLLRTDSTASPEFDDLTDLLGAVRTALLEDQAAAQPDEGDVCNGWGLSYGTITVDPSLVFVDNHVVFGGVIEVEVVREVRETVPEARF